MTTSDKTCRLSLSRPSIGFTTLAIGGIELKGVSYINPFLLFDLRDFVRDMTLGKNCSMDIDCESYGMAHIEYTPTGDIIVSAPDQPNETHDWNLLAEPTKMAKELADSIESNIDEWALWKDDDELSPNEAIEEVKGIVNDLRTYANLVNNKIIDISNLIHAYLDVKPKELTAADAWYLWATLLETSYDAKKHNAWDRWQLQKPRIQAAENGSLVCCVIHVDGSYFTDRQIAFIRNDGLIELAGWTDKNNSLPLQWAFARWATETSHRHY